MNDAVVRRLTGISGVLIGIGTALLIPLYFMYSGPPPAWNVLTRDLIGLILAAVLIVFVAGFSHLIRQADATYQWIASLVYGTGLVHVAVILVGTSLEAGAVFGTPNGTIDPTIDGPLAEGSILLRGSIGRILNALFLVTAGYSVLRTRLLPAWLGWAAYGGALLNLACVPSIYFGKNAAQFYSAIGWGNSALAASLLGYWILGAGIMMLRRPRSVP